MINKNFDGNIYIPLLFDGMGEIVHVKNRCQVLHIH